MLHTSFVWEINVLRIPYIKKQDIKYKLLSLKHIFQIMNRIKEVLTAKGVKQTWLADQLGKSYNMVNAYVQNRQQPRLEVLYKIAELLNVSVKDLLIEPHSENENYQ